MTETGSTNFVESYGKYKQIEGQLTHDGQSFKTVDEMMEVLGIDREKREDYKGEVVTRHVPMKDKEGEPVHIQNWRAKVFLRKIARGFNKEEFIESAKEYMPNYEKREYPNLNRGVLLELNPFDLHFNKLADKETSGEEYNVEIAKQRFSQAIDELLGNLSGFDIERIVLPLGSDLLNIDGDHNGTTRGTPQDTEKFYEVAIKELRQFLITQIDKLSNIAPVDVVMVKGNHDEISTFHLGDSLECWYHKCPDVNVDNGMKTRKYYRYGNSLIGYTHGGEEKIAELPLLMMRENQKQINDVEHMEFHLGHFHKKKGIHFVGGDEFNGINVLHLGSLTGTDRRHNKKGYGSVPRLEAFIRTKEKGRLANFDIKL